MMSNESDLQLGIDIGGSKISLCTYDGAFELVSHKEIPTALFRQRSLLFIDDLEAFILNKCPRVRKRIGISFKGSITAGVITYSSLLGGQVNYQLASRFSKKFGCPVTVDNDVVCMTKAESRYGKGRGVSNFTLVNLGTGLRLGYCENGRVLSGKGNNFGEISSLTLTVPELEHSSASLDDLLSGRGISHMYYKLTGQEKSAKDIFYDTHNPYARTAREIFTHYMAELLRMVSCFYNPELIVFAGSVMKSHEFFFAELREQYREITPILLQATSLVISELNHSACLGSLLV